MLSVEAGFVNTACVKTQHMPKTAIGRQLAKWSFAVS